MSAIGGIYQYQGGRVSVQDLHVLSTALEHRGPDGGRRTVGTSVGMLHLSFYTDLESRTECQPHESSSGHVVAWNGRLDNRSDLTKILCAHSSTTDVELSLAAYLHWGEDFPAHLVGDFALSLWDPRTHVLILACDHAGVRTLYYHDDGERIVWSSTLAPLIDFFVREIRIDDDYVAGLFGPARDPLLTPYKGIYAVQPGHLVRVNRSGAKNLRRYWNPSKNQEIRYSNDSDYEEHFRELFASAVRSRLRSDRPVFGELSGGLDSSSIVCMARRLIADGDATAPALHTVSYVSDESSSSDERPFIRLVEEHCGENTNLLHEEQLRFFTPMPDTAGVGTISPLLSSFAYHSSVGQLMEMKHSRLLLSGIGGDEMLQSTNDPTPELADLFWTLKFPTLHSRLKMWSEWLKEPYVSLLWNRAIVPVLPHRFRVSRSGEAQQQVSNIFTPDFVERTALRNVRLGRPDELGFHLPSQKYHSRAFCGAVANVSRGFVQESYTYDVSYPYLDRTLVEFLFAIPFSQLLRPAESRSLMRRSLNGVLPEALLKRRGKGSPGEVLCRAIAREWHWISSLLDNARLVTLGYAQSVPLKAAFERARSGRASGTGLLVGLLNLELWLRMLEARQTYTGQPRAAPRSFSEEIVGAAYTQLPRTARR